jgi:hypothetical protein
MGNESIAHHLSILINHAFDNDLFPDILKLAEVSSVFKRNDNLDKRNYRPISLLTVMSKVYEHVMAKQLSMYFEAIFSALLSAFRKRYSCQSTLLNMIEKFKTALDNNEHVAAISMDLSKAFDCLPHCLTICKLRAYGVSKKACMLICSYLYKRKQRVKINSTRSKWTDITKGIPQGSIIGPLIFNIFLNDIFYFAEQSDLYNYADDNCTAVHHDDINTLTELLTSETNVMIEWFTNNGMQVNPSKFQGVLFKANHINPTIDIRINDQSIPFVNDIKVLGITIDDKLNFNTHINTLCSKAGAQVSALQRLTGVLDLKSRMAIYKSFIAANFNYCPIVCFFTSRSSINRMEKVQERALRFVLKDSSSGYQSLLNKAGIDSIRIGIVKMIAVEVYKILNDLSPDYMNTMFVRSTNPYNLRDNNRVVQPRTQSMKYGIKSFRYFGSHLWNSMPLEIKSAISLHNFKQLVKRWVGPNCKCHICLSLL